MPVIILGGGGHAKVLIDALLLQRRKVLGYIARDKGEERILGFSYLGDERMILEWDPKKLKLVNGLGSIRSTSSRKELYDRFRRKGYHFESVVHPSAVIASGVRLEEGVQIMARVVVGPESRLGTNTLVNTGAVVDHDCNIGAHVHIAPGAVLNGNVRIEGRVHVGTGAIIIQGLVIGSNSVIGAGSVVIDDVPEGVTVVGVPAKVIRYHDKK
jgi:sugar O-acyltransferase (sialic acid O-acetyltransferase NeuD family)